MKAYDTLWGYCAGDQWLANFTQLHTTAHDFLFSLAQGMSDCLRCPVCSCAIFVLPFARETAGAARIRHSLLPLLRDNETQTSGVSRRANADVYLLFEIRIEMSLRHCERSEAIHFTKQRKSGLLVRQESWRGPAGERPVRVGRSGRPVASVAWSPATAGAKRTQRLCGVCH